MKRAGTDLTLFRSSLRGYFESAFENGQIDSRTCDRIKAWLGRRESDDCARQLSRDGTIDIPEPALIRVQVKRLREMDGREFAHIEVTPIPDTGRPRRKCFLGHRFSRSIERTLRWNLRQLLEPYNVELDWSGRDPRSVQILEDIVGRIKAADFCVFDNRGAGRKPNVYIEVGMCIALQKPFILFEYSPPSSRRGMRAAIPSDLSHALALRYSSYKQLFRHFYSRLPVFFAKNMP